MTIEELKQHILNKSLNDKLLIFKYSDNKILTDLYISEISKLKNKQEIYIKNLEVSSSDFFDIDDFYIYILNVDKLETNIVNIDDYDNYIIVCKEVEYQDKLKDYIVEFPKIESWQIIDYACAVLPGLNISEIEWLYSICNSDERFMQEVDKLKLFNEQTQSYIFNLINQENGYADLNSLNIYNFTNAILHKDIKTVKEVLMNFDYIDIEPTGVVTILYKNFKNVLNIQMNPQATAESLGLTTKQFNAIKYYSLGYYTNKELIKIFEFLTSIDYRLKSGQFTLPRRSFVEFIVNKILGVI